MFRNSIVLRRSLSKLLFKQSTCHQELITKYCATVLISCTHDLAIKQPVLPKENVEPVNRFVSRTHTCGELRIKNIGENVQLSGWLEFSRMYNKFLILRDSYGSVQCIVPEDRKDLEEITKNLTFESVLSIEGTVLKRPDGQRNKNMPTGDIEIEVESLKVLNMAKPNLPFIIRDYNKAKESNQLKYRYISLRYPELQKYLRLRSKMIMKMREYLIKECGFVDIETPTLFKNTPEGAKEFIVPTRIPGQFYSLVQSPQQFKQLLMVGGFDRYFQVARCYRDETPRHDRQPEFTQLDIEMSFTDSEGIMELIENLLAYSWPEESDGITVPFKRMKYDDAMEFYGTDKPDLRIPQKLHRLTDLIDRSSVKQNLKIEQNGEFEVYALVFSEKHDLLTKSVKETMSELQSKYYPSVKLIQTKIPTQSAKIAEIIRETVESKLNLKPGDVLFLACGEKILTQSLLGRVRVDFTNLLESKDQKIRTAGNELLWITDFPLFSFDTETNRLETMHHPFTKPHPDDMQYLAENPLKVRGLHYDLVMNGSEIAGGSIRIHEAKLQKEILRTLNVDESHLTHMLEALESGAPPHGGIAIGLDRLMCLLCRTENIKNVIAFPKTMSGRDLMSGAPIPISEEEKQLYHIRTVDE
ncbi:aspartate--tRNA ligase, mitochondrial [Ceratina calcarata]|uniref:Aspartate--tRNA ligase, mitochondrial n=1 Tax=Ceratina calcarata TaxID=156304 RepID=A0AAJ7J5P5_9HYME|nr:aspartate--tRNA ligase, mitochondrial [Ceratina calcarata]